MKFCPRSLGRSLIVSIFLCITFSFSLTGQSRDSTEKAKTFISIGVENNYFAFGSLRYKNLELEPVISLFSNRLSEQYAQITIAYYKEINPLFTLKASSGLNRAIDLENLFVTTEVKFRQKGYQLLFGVDYTNNLNQEQTKINYFYELEIGITPEIAFAYYYQPPPVWSFNRNHEFGVHFKQPKLSVIPAILIDPGFDLQKALFMISFSYLAVGER